LLFRDNTRHLRDILEAIDLIQLFLRDMTFESYQTDLKTKSAVERQMQIMTAAAIRFGGMPNGLRPGRIGKVSGGWGTSSGMLITELTTKLSGIPFRMSFRSCVKLSWMHSGRTAPMSRIAG
jgi:Ribonuclease HepT-like